jgi:phage tail tape-measure protein
MATTSDTLEIIIRLKDKASRGIKTMARGLGAVRGRISKLTKSFTGLKAAIAGVGAGLLARSFVQAADTAEQYRVRLNVLLGSTKEGNRAFKEMAEYASGVSYSYEEIMGAATTLAGVMEGGVDEIKKWMPMIADLAAVAGVSVQEATSQIVRMYSAGAGAADLFRDRGILAMLGFQAKTAYTAKQTRDMLTKAFEDPQSKFRGVSEDLAKTWSGMLSMMGDRWFQFRNLVMEEGGVFDYMKAGVMVYLEWTDKLKKEGTIDEWAKSMGEAVINTFETIVLGAAGFLDAVMPIIHGVKVVLGSILDVWKEMPDWMQEIGIVAAIFGGRKAAVAIGALSHLYNAAQNTGKGIALVAKGFLSFEEFADMNFEELDKFIKEFEAQMGIIETKADEIKDSGDAAVGDIKEKVQAFLTRLREIREQLRKEREKETPGVPRKPKEKPVDTKLVAATTKAEARLAIEQNKTMLDAIEADWENHNITLEGYFKERTALMLKEFEIQIQLLEAQAAATKDPAKRAALEGQIHVLREKQLQAEIALQQDYKAAVDERIEKEREAADIVAGIQNRLAQAGAGVSIAAQQKLETEELMRLQKEEIDELLELQRQGAEVEKEIHAAKNKHILEQEQLAANQRKEIWDMYIGSVGSLLGDMTDMFLEFYKASGSKSKEMFNLFKAASIARALIATYESATKAYNSMIEVPVVGPALAASAAAIAIATGMAKVQLIRQQQMAEGGIVQGMSPYPTADNIPIKATAGEFMHPVPTVKYYGRRGMEAIRRMLVPAEVIQAFASPGLTIPRGARLAEGGVAERARGENASGQTLNMGVKVVLPEQLDFIGRRLESEIEPVVVRVLQEELKY